MVVNVLARHGYWSAILVEGKLLGDFVYPYPLVSS